MHTSSLPGPLPLSDSVAITIIAGLLGVLPVVVLLWIYYVRERTPSVSGAAVSRFFALGMLAVAVSVALERAVYAVWARVSPDTARFFFAENIAVSGVASLAVVGSVSFLAVALVEEGVRYVLMRAAIRRSRDLDQIIDGVQYGIALGLGFAFVENTLYFLQLFRGLDFSTLAVVFFLRFLISTVGHMAFGGVMGYLLARSLVHPTERRVYARRAFLFPWLMHGSFDLLLSIQMSFYTVILLLVPLLLFWYWWNDSRLFEVHVLHGRRLRFPIPSSTRHIHPLGRHVVDVLPSVNSCPNCYMSLADADVFCRSCGVRLHRRGVRSRFPFLPGAGAVEGAADVV